MKKETEDKLLNVVETKEMQEAQKELLEIQKKNELLEQERKQKELELLDLQLEEAKKNKETEEELERLGLVRDVNGKIDEFAMKEKAMVPFNKYKEKLNDEIKNGDFKVFEFNQNLLSSWPEGFVYFRNFYTLKVEAGQKIKVPLSIWDDFNDKFTYGMSDSIRPPKHPDVNLPLTPNNIHEQEGVLIGDNVIVD